MFCPDVHQFQHSYHGILSTHENKCGDSLLPQWKDIQDILLIEKKKIKVKKSTQSAPHFCVNSKVLKKSLWVNISIHMYKISWKNV